MKNQRNKQKRKKPAMRTCIFCRSKKPKKDMIRFVLSEEDKPIIDSTGKKSGRGVNVCANISCFSGAIKRGLFEKAWHKQVDSTALTSLKSDFEEAVRRKKLRKGSKNIKYRVKKEKVDKVLGKKLVRLDKDKSD
jgi:hypothetical protein